MWVCEMESKVSCFLNSVIEEDEYEDDEVVEVDISALGTSSVITEAKPQDDHHFVRIFNECQAYINIYQFRFSGDYYH